MLRPKSPLESGRAPGPHLTGHRDDAGHLVYLDLPDLLRRQTLLHPEMVLGPPGRHGRLIGKGCRAESRTGQSCLQYPVQDPANLLRLPWAVKVSDFIDLPAASDCLDVQHSLPFLLIILIAMAHWHFLFGSRTGLSFSLPQHSLNLN